VWVASNDRGRTYETHRFSDHTLAELPLRFLEDEAIIRRIDVIWLKGSVVHEAFEVESTTNIRDGMQRMATLIKELPNPRCGLRIVVPQGRVSAVAKVARGALIDRDLVRRFSYMTFEELRANFGQLVRGEKSLSDFSRPVVP
jgi:type II restriction enzyme